MKRRCVETVASCTRSKKPKLLSDPSHELDIEYIPATCTRNFMLKDPLVDWLKSNSNSKSKYKYTFPDNDDDGFYSFIMNKGVEFEAELIKYINQHRLPVVTVSQYITKESINKTIELMKLGTPIIHSAPVQNPENHTHGIIDILIRSDHLHLLVDDYPLTDEEKIKEMYHPVILLCGLTIKNKFSNAFLEP